MEAEAPPIVPGRSCANCTMCCKVFSIAELQKPSQVWCTHCAIGQGCKIYADRPSDCRAFHCLFLTDPNMGAHWRPARSRLVVSYDAPNHRVLVSVDNDRPNAWIEDPFYSEIKAWARAASTNGGQVLVINGQKVIAVLPDKEVNLGEVRGDQFILTTQDQTPAGTIYGAVLVEAGDPRIAKR